jgi:hypothetical protein
METTLPQCGRLVRAPALVVMRCQIYVGAQGLQCWGIGTLKNSQLSDDIPNNPPDREFSGYAQARAETEIDFLIWIETLPPGGFKFERKHHLTTLERMVRWQEIAYD